MNNTSGNTNEGRMPRDDSEVSLTDPEKTQELVQNSDSSERNILPKIERKNGEINPEVQTDSSRSAVASAIQDDNSKSSNTQAADDDNDQTEENKKVVKPSSSMSPEIADDIDLIEKEWVEKAKEIVHQTKDDPRQQNIALGKMKADYLKKRFNKTITTDNDT